MPVVQANGIDINYEVQGEGEPMVLIPYLAADQACYAFQVAEYAKHYTCFSVDLRGAGLSGKPDGVYTTDLFADDIAAFMQAAGIGQSHVFGLSLGAAAGASAHALAMCREVGAGAGHPRTVRARRMDLNHVRLPIPPPGQGAFAAKNVIIAGRIVLSSILRLKPKRGAKPLPIWLLSRCGPVGGC